MKKAILTILAVLAFVTIISGINTLSNHYERTATVTEVNENEVTFEDESGNCWEWELEEGEHFSEGQSVTLKMDTNNTDNNIYDDIIIRVEV